ncbi:MAG: zinc-finger domain-containing protein [Rubellimicrobium sp.]|nr:zinc-finger domain-containing protein [Rubellimicrobium sp.]
MTPQTTPTTPTPPETLVVQATRIACDGGEGALGHPRVWLTIVPEVGHVDCPYCGRHYVAGGDAAAH